MDKHHHSNSINGIKRPRTAIGYAPWLLALCAFSCARSDSHSEKKSQASDSAELFSLALISTQTCPTPEVESDPDRKLLSFEVALSSDAPIPINYRYASLITQDGSRYLAEHFGCKPLFNSSPLIESRRVQGFLNFALPDSKEAIRIEYAPDLSHLREPLSASQDTLPFELIIGDKEK